MEDLQREGADEPKADGKHFADGGSTIEDDAERHRHVLQQVFDVQPMKLHDGWDLGHHVRGVCQMQAQLRALENIDEVPKPVHWRLRSHEHCGYVEPEGVALRR